MILSDYLENALLDHLLKNTAYTKPALYFGLFTADPGESGVTGELTIGSLGYARKQVTNDNTNFPPCAITGAAIKTNATAIVFGPASGSWGTVTHWALYDASTAGNMLCHGALAESRTVVSGDSPKFSAGTLSITATNTGGGGLTALAQRKLLDHVFGGPSYTPPAAVFTGLGTALTGEVMTEWTESTYARQETGFDSASAGMSKNAAQETYTGDVADSLDATITHFGIYDAVTSGNLLAVGPISSPFVAANDDSVTLADEALTVTFQ